MLIRKANSKDKKPVLEFCKSTFSWGDYIKDVWDNWLNEGNLLVAVIQKKPIGLIHSLQVNKKLTWVEGIRINKDFRRKGIASQLLKKTERLSKKKDSKFSKMLIATNNKKSINLAKKENYEQEGRWTFYSLKPRNASKTPVKFLKEMKKLKDLSSLSQFYYINSWRWIPISTKIMKQLIKKRQIVYFEKENKVHSLASFVTSKHFPQTIIITIITGNKNEVKNILKFSQNFCKKNNIKRIQIISNLKNFPEFRDLKKRFSFYLMKKNLY